MTTLTKSTGTVTLSGTAEKVNLPAVYGWVWVKNMSDADMFAGLSADISEGADGVMVIPAGECGRIQTDGFNSIYLMGTGNALVVAQNYADCPFKVGVKGGESPDLSEYAKKTEIPTELPANGGDADTVDGLHANGFIKVNSYDGYDCNTLYDAGLYLCGVTATNTPNDLKYGSLFVMPYRKPYGNEGPDYCAQIFIPNGDVSDASMWYRTSLQNTWNEWKRSCDDGNADTLDGLHANEIATNPNLLINPDFKINQRGETDFSVAYHQGTPIPQSQKYTVDRWRIMDGEANISNGKFVLNGTIIQVLENSIGSDFTATVSVESGTATASYNDSTKTFTIVGNNAVLNWAKLEYGSVATPFIPPDTATELLKCMRYYEILLPSIADRAVTGYLETGRNAIFDMKFSVPKRCVPSLTSNYVRIIVNTFDSYLAILNNCPVNQGETDKNGIVIASADPVISSDSSGYIGVSMDALHNADLAVDAEIY